MDIDETEICRFCFTTKTHHINIFDEAQCTTAEVINEHIGVVSVSDGLPKTVCIDCWNTTETFHKFHHSVKSAQAAYLKGLVKCELTEAEFQQSFCDEFEDVKPPNFVEVVASNITYEDLNSEIVTNMNFKKLHDLTITRARRRENSSNLVEISKVPDREDDQSKEFDIASNVESKYCSESEDESIDGSAFIDTDAANKSVYYANFDYSCDICKLDLKSLKNAKIHYKNKHAVADGYIKCCGLKLKRQTFIDDHIQWHINPDIFMCNICGMRLKTRAAVCIHISRHKILERLICDLCGKTFKDKNQIKRHLFTHLHTFMCELCSKRCPSQQSLEAHERFAHKFVCKQCPKRYSSQQGLEAHEQFTHNAADIPVRIQTQLDMLKKIDSTVLTASETEQLLSKHFDMTCDVCGDGLRSLQQAQFHYMHEHEQPDGYIKCCGIKFNKNESVKGHIDWHTDPESFKCVICGILKNSTRNLRAHLKIHSAPQPKQSKWNCNECNQSYVRKFSLTNHMERVHGHVPTNKISTGDSGVSNENNLSVTDYFDMKCDVCSVTLASLQHAKMHYLDEHANNDGYIKCCGVKFKDHYLVNEHLRFHLNPDILKCNICGMYFATKKILQRHLLKHQQKEQYTCAICEKVLSGKVRFDQHIKNHEQRKNPQNDQNGAKKFPCRFCINRRFKTEEQRKGHEDRIHLRSEELKTELCEFCAKPFGTQREVLCHIRAIHSNQKQTHEPAQCEVCDAWLSNRYRLKRHMQRHTYEPHKCPHCDVVKPNRGNLVSHIRMVHIERIHKCHLCDKSFKAASALKSHVAIHTGEKLYKCSFCSNRFFWRTDMYKHQKKSHPEEWSQNRAKKLSTANP